VTSRHRRSKAFAAVVLLGLIVLALAACGGDGESENDEEGEAERVIIQCEGSAVTPELPADFPTVEGVTITKSEEAGPSQVADGYYEGSLEDAYEAFKTAIRDAGYSVIFDEIEEEDSEVAYSGGDENTSGIVALRENCAQSGRISVHITSRPE
jgi:hypothetical protein